MRYTVLASVDENHEEFLSSKQIRINVQKARERQFHDSEHDDASITAASTEKVSFEDLPIPGTKDFCIIMNYPGFKAKRSEFISDTGDPDPFGLRGNNVGAMYLHLTKTKDGDYALVCNVRIAKSMQRKGLGVLLYNHALKFAKRYYHVGGLVSNPEDRNQRSNPFWEKWGQAKIGNYDVIKAPISKK